MVATQEPNSEQPNHGADQKQANRPRSFYRIGQLLAHEHAPHWTIAFFTLLLVIFACAAWVESTRGTGELQKQARALQDQLDILRAGQRPFMFIVDAPVEMIDPARWQPKFYAENGQIGWNIAYANFGRDVAFHMTIIFKIKLGDEEFHTSSVMGSNVLMSPNRGVDLPPGVPKFGTAWSRIGISQSYFDSLMKKEGGIKAIIEFRYSDGSLKDQFVNGVCVVHNGNSSPSFASVEDCG